VEITDATNRVLTLVGIGCLSGIDRKRRSNEEEHTNRRNMLHKGKLQAALNLKRGQLRLRRLISEQLGRIPPDLENALSTYQSSAQLEHNLSQVDRATGRGRPSIGFDRLVGDAVIAIIMPPQIFHWTRV